jgi:DNA-binding response OmpR family regulator
MTICPECGQPTDPPRSERGPLVALADPPAVYYRGVRLALSPQQARILGLLVREGWASYAMIDLAAMSLKSSAAATKVEIYNIRRNLPRGVEIVNEYGRGYRLDVA